MASVLDSIGLRPRVKAVPTVPDIGPYFAKVGDSRSKAQIGFGAWGADYPSPAGFIPPLLGCAAFVAAAPGTEHQSRRVLRSLTRQGDGPRHRPAVAGSSGRDTALAADRAEILAQAPVVPTDNRRNVDFLSKRVGNYQYNPQWGVLLEQLWLR